MPSSEQSIANRPIADHPIPFLLLASASPRRAEILEALGIPFRSVNTDVDESLRQAETAQDAASRLAAAKAERAAAAHPGQWVLAADTLVFLGGEILGKPRDDEDAVRMLRLLSGREHGVVTAVRLRRDTDPGDEVREESRVRIAPLSEEELLWYVATGEPRDKAGAYAVQGKGSRFIESVEGSYTNVMGLPARGVYRLLRGVRDPALARLALAAP